MCHVIPIDKDDVTDLFRICDIAKREFVMKCRMYNLLEMSVRIKKDWKGALHSQMATRQATAIETVLFPVTAWARLKVCKQNKWSLPPLEAVGSTIILSANHEHGSSTRVVRP